MTKCRGQRVICRCEKCHPGKEVALRTRQLHYQVEGRAQIPKTLSSGSTSLLDSGTNGTEYYATEFRDDSSDEEEMDYPTGMDFIMILMFRGRRP